MSFSTSSPRTKRAAHIALCLGMALIAQSFLGGLALAQSEGSAVFRSSWKSIEPLDALSPSNGEVNLTLQEAIAIALSQNLGLQIQRYDRAVSLFTAESRESIYDLFASSSFSLSDETSPSASQLDGADIQQSETTFLSLRLDQSVGTGGTASIDWRNVRSESNSVFSQINPLFRVDFDLLFSQPLLRGFGKENFERDLRVARLDASISLENLEIQIIDTIQQVENAYWGLVEARAQLEVSRESLALTEQLHQMNQIQVDVGTKAPLELIQSEAGIASDREAIIRDAAAAEDAADVLRQLLNVDGEAAWLATIIPTTEPETERIQIDLSEAFATAEQERREITNQELALEQLELDSRFFKNQKLPSLDLELRYGYNGLGGDIAVLDPGGNPFDPGAPTTIIPGGYSDAIDQVTAFDFRGWSAGINFSYPIQNRQARANSLIADLRLERGKLALDEQTLAIRTEVRRTARAVTTAAEQIDSARASRRLQEKNVEAQQKRYENGLSTSFEVLQIQEDLAAARSREVQSVTGYRRALVSYYRAIGRLLDEKGIRIEDTADPRALMP